MSTVRRVAKNAGALFLGNNLTKILTFVLTIFLARYLKDVGFGKLSFAIEFTALFAVLIDFGINVIIIREVARNKDETSKYLGNALTLKFFLSIIALALIYFAINLMGYPPETRMAVYIAALIIIVQSFAVIFESVFQAFEHMEYGMFAKILRVLLRLALTLPILFLGYGVIAVLLIYLFVSVVNLMMYAVICTRKIIIPKFNFDFSFIKHLLKKSWSFAFMSVFTVLYMKIDITMLSKMQSDAVVGWYSAAYNLIFSLEYIPIAIGGALLPVAAVLYKNRDKMIMIYERMFRFLFSFTFPIAVGTTLLADKIILLIYGNDFINSIVALQILIWVILINFTLYASSVVLIALNKERQGMYVQLVCAIVNVVLNLIVIPKLSYIGASITTIISAIVFFVIVYFLLKKYLYTPPILRMIYKPIFAGLLMGLAVYYLSFLNLFVVIALGAVIYAGIMYLIGAITEEDKEILFKIIGGKQAQ